MKNLHNMSVAPRKKDKLTIAEQSSNGYNCLNRKAVAEEVREIEVVEEVVEAIEDPVKVVKKRVKKAPKKVVKETVAEVVIED